MMHGFRWGIGLSAMAAVLGGLGMWRAERAAQPVLVEVPFPEFAQLPALPPLPLPPPTMDGAADSIQVRAVSQSSGAPLAGARVSLLRGLFASGLGERLPDETALTDASGVVSFMAPGAGVMTVCARSGRSWAFIVMCVARRSCPARRVRRRCTRWRFSSNSRAS